MEGTKVGSYEVKALLGKGGMGEVYLAEHTLLRRPVAIKFLLSSLSADEELVERFFNEAKATTAVADPGIVQIFDFGYHIDGSAYIVMEYLEGETLDNRIEGDGPLDEVPALRIARHLANALGAAHKAGVIHRDLKLENVFLVGDPAVPGGERPKILDFGIAKLSRAEPGKSKTRTGAIMGTPIYMSPEQCKGAHDVDARSDLYSLGCLLHCMVIGRPPFDYESAGELIAAHLREEAPVPSTIRGELSVTFDRLIARCLAKDPGARYQSMAELSRAITDILGDEVASTRTGRSSPALRLSGAATPTPGSTTPAPLAQPTTLSSAAGATVPPTARRSGRWLIAVASLLIAAAGGAAVVRLSQSKDDTKQPAAAPVPVPVAAPVPVPEPVPVPVAVPVPVPESVPVPVAVPEAVPVAVPETVAETAPVTKPSGKRPKKPIKKPAAGSGSGSSGPNAGNMDRGD